MRWTWSPLPARLYSLCEMSRTAVIVGGTGQIGRAAARSLLDAGWAVTLISRGHQAADAHLAGLLEAGAQHVVADRGSADFLAGAIGSGADVLIDTIAFTPAHADQLLAVASSVGSMCVISTAAVYADRDGRSLESDTFPDFAGPLLETDATVPPTDQSYATSKVAMEHRLLNASPVPVSIIRPCLIHGPGHYDQREWYFFKRALEGRRRVALAYRGESRFQTTSTVNLGRLCLDCAVRPADRILNCGDPDQPTVQEIAAAIGAAMAYEFDLVPIDGPPGEGGGGGTPWSSPRPLLLDMTGAEREVGYVPAATYAEAVPETCAWLREACAGDLTPPASLPDQWFDYAAEDKLLT